MLLNNYYSLFSLLLFIYVGNKHSEHKHRTGEWRAASVSSLLKYLYVKIHHNFLYSIHTPAPDTSQGGGRAVSVNLIKYVIILSTAVNTKCRQFVRSFLV